MQDGFARLHPRAIEKEKDMKFLMLITVLAGALYAGDNNSKVCNEATIKGSYGYTVTFVRPTSPGLPHDQAFGVGVRRFDGVGGFTQADTIKGTQNPVARDFTGFGTYSINPDCTGKAFMTVEGVPGTAEQRLVVADKGKEIFWILVEPPGPVAVGRAVRQ